MGGGGRMSEWALVGRMCTSAWGAVVCVQHLWWAYGGRLAAAPCTASWHLMSDLPASVPSGSSSGSEIRRSSASSSGTGSKLQEKGWVGDCKCHHPSITGSHASLHAPRQPSTAQPSQAVHAEPTRACHAPNRTLTSEPQQTTGNKN